MIGEVLEWFTSRKHNPRKCYLCWQVQENETKQRDATCIVLQNPGTKHEWKCVSCDVCAQQAESYTHVPPGRIIARLL